jgi:hypothetical protein
MKIVPLFVITLFYATACNRPNEKIKEYINTTDSVAINFFKGDGTTYTVVAVKMVRNKKVIEDLSSIISASAAKPPVKCGYDGSLHFFKNNRVMQDIGFRMNDAACMYFTFKQEGELKASVLSKEAFELLQNIRK